MKVIVKKIRTEFFEEILKGNKTFELRKEDDVQYDEGDILILKETETTISNKEMRIDCYTGRFAISRIGYVLRHFEGLAVDYAIISLKDTQFCDLSINNDSLLY